MRNKTYVFKSSEVIGKQPKKDKSIQLLVGTAVAQQSCAVLC